jgi:signal transduction histidine kinase
MKTNMRQTERPRGYQGGYLIGLIVLVVVALRTILFYAGLPNLFPAAVLLTAFALLYLSEPWFSNRFPAYRYFYFPAQTVLVSVFCYLHPFLDMKVVLFVPLFIQAFRIFSRQVLLFVTIFYMVLIVAFILPNLGFLEGAAFILLGVAVSAFFISYDFLYSRTQADQAESQRLLVDLQSAHTQLQKYAAQAEELAAVRERNRLARELHDSVSQAIFSITLTSQSIQVLLEREPARVPAMLDRLMELTSSALSQLRSIIAELRPPQNP